MAIIPMRQIILVYKAELDNAGDTLLDLNGNPTFLEPISVMCRVDEGSRLIKNRSNGYIISGEQVGKASIYIDKLANIKYNDQIEFENELGEKIIAFPAEINVKRGINGKPILTEVII